MTMKQSSEFDNHNEYDRYTRNRSECCGPLGCNKMHEESWRRPSSRSCQRPGNSFNQKWFELWGAPEEQRCMQRQTDARDGIMSSNAQKYSRMGDVLANKWMRADNVFRAMDKYDSPEVLSPVFGGLTGSNLDPWFCSSYCGDEMMVTENEREYLVTLAIPGCDRKNVSVNIREHKGGRSFLEIAWHYKKKFGSSNENVLWMGRSWSSGQRNFPIPSSCDKSRINADMKNGSLVITMPKSERPCKNYSLARNKPINFC